MAGCQSKVLVKLLKLLCFQESDKCLITELFQ